MSSTGYRWITTAPTFGVGRRLAPGAAVLGLLLVLAVLASGCGGSAGQGVAQAPKGQSTNSSSSSSSSAKGNAAAYSACMRKNGVPDFPDPDSQGRINIEGGEGTNGQKIGLRVDSPQFKSAEQACRRLKPSGLTPTPQQQAKAREQMLKYSQCMRSHGVPKFPDPTFSPNGGGKLTFGIDPNSGIDPASAQFQAAQKACKQFTPGGVKFRGRGGGQ